MPDALITNTGSKFLESGPIGAVALLLVFAIVAVVKLWRDDVKALNLKRDEEVKTLTDRLDKEVDDHQLTREKWLTDVKTYASVGETMRADQRSAMIIIQQTSDTLKDFVKEQSRR